jgi:hypothetical protein
VTKEQLKIAAVLLLGVLVGGVSLRYGQHVVIENFKTCMDEGLQSVQTIGELVPLQEKCAPSKIVRHIFFW